LSKERGKGRVSRGRRGGSGTCPIKTALVYSVGTEGEKQGCELREEGESGGGVVNSNGSSSLEKALRRREGKGINGSPSEGTSSSKNSRHTTFASEGEIKGKNLSSLQILSIRRESGHSSEKR